MQDLQALANQQSWTELLDQATRVDPSARSADWTKLVRAAATHVIDQIAQGSDSDWRAAERLVEVIPTAERKYAFLTSDKPYVEAKAKAVGRVVEACAGRGGCGAVIEALADGIQRFPKGIARQIALLLSDDETPVQAVHFWALAADDDSETCRDGRLEHAVLGVLRGTTGGRQLADAQRTTGTCYAALEQGLVRELIASNEAAKERPPFLRNACATLKSHGTMTVLKKKKCP